MPFDELWVNQQIAIAWQNYWHHKGLQNELQASAHLGEITAYQTALKEFENTPKPPLAKTLDIEKLYDGIVKFYVDKRKYSVESANRIAQSVVERQIMELHQ
jgi:hypothetical protein